MIKKYIVLLGLLLLPGLGFGQSIYSSIGMGEMTLPSTTRAAGMGIQGVALEDFNEISLINPALWYLPRLTGLTLEFQSSNYNFSSGKNNYSEFDGFNFHFPIAGRLGVALGFSPYTYVGYNFEREGNQSVLSSTSFADTVRYSSTQTGTGGVGAGFAGVGWLITNKLSIGASISVLIGQIDVTQRFQVTEPDDYISRSISSVSNVYGSNVVLGASYRSLFRENDNLGFRAEIPLSLLIRREDDYLTGAVDTTEISDLLWPYQFSAGYTLSVTSRWRTAIEASYWLPEDDLTGYVFDSKQFDLTSALRIGLGMEYRFSLDPDSWWDRLSWRTGIRYNQFLESTAAGEQPSGIEWVGGVGVPFNQGMNRLDLSFFVGQRSGPTDAFIDETRAGVQIGITVSEPWFRGGIRNN
jgi:hypothetical protein